MVGAVISGLCLLTLGFTKEIVGYFVSDESTAKSLTIFAAVLAIYAVDFAVNAGSYMTCPPSNYAGPSYGQGSRCMLL